MALLRVAILPFDRLAALHAGPLARAAEELLENDRVYSGEAETLSDLLHGAAGASAADPERAKARFAILRLRRDLHNRRAPDPVDLELGRSLLSSEALARLRRSSEMMERRVKARASYEAAFAEAIRLGRREVLNAVAGDPLVEHGIYLASRSLVPKLRRASRSDPSRASHDERHTVAKAASYLARMAAKTSPNGVFCAVALAPCDGPSVRLEGSAGISHVDALLSLAEVRKVTACLAVDPAVERAIVPRPNPTLREREGAWSFWRPASSRNATDEEVHSRAKDHPILRAFLEEAGRGVHDPSALLRAVAERSGIPAEELRSFYQALVERGILLAEIEIAYSRRRRLREMAAAARRAGCEAGWIAPAEWIEEAVDAIPRLEPHRRTEAMKRIMKEFESLPRKRPFKPEELFRVDSASSLRLRLPGRVLEDLRGPIDLFARLLSGIYPERLHHRDLVARFLKLHPADTDVDFLELYGGDFVPKEEPVSRPTEFPAPGNRESEEAEDPAVAVARKRVWDWFVERARRAAPGESVELDEAVLRSLIGELPEPRWSAGVLFQLAARSAGDVDEGRYSLVVNAIFNGIGLALARFAHLLGGDRTDSGNPVIAELRQAWRVMERPGAVLAELTFNHEARTANAGLRPVLFGHEIELVGDKASPEAAAIPLNDLVIRYDSAADRLVLRSVSHEVEVIPVLSSGVSPSGIVTELVHIGRQGWQSVGYLPGFHAPSVRRWPRFVCGKVVLFRARWVFPADEAPLPSRRTGALPSDAEFFLQVARWRELNDLPRHLFAHTSAEPKPFYVDLESPVLVDVLRRALPAPTAGAEAVLFVTEMLPGPEELWVQDASGGYATEFLVQLGGIGALSHGVAARRPRASAPSDQQLSS